MPKGPFGLPRLTAVGPLVEEDQDPQELLEEIARRPHSYRGYNPEEFIKILDSGEVSKYKIRQELDIIESNRLDPLLKSLHKFWNPLDNDEKVIFAKRNPGLIQWLEVWARSQDLRRPSEDINISDL